MNLVQIKESVGVPQLELNQATDIDGKPAVTKNEDGTTTKWFRHWDNENRVAVSIAEDLLLEIKADTTISSLGLQKEVRQGDKGDYTSYRIVKYTPAEHSL